MVNCQDNFISKSETRNNGRGRLIQCVIQTIQGWKTNQRSVKVKREKHILISWIDGKMNLQQCI